MLQPYGDIIPKFWSLQQFRELVDPGSDSLAIEIGIGLNNRLNIKQILGTMGDRFHDDKIFGCRQANAYRTGLLDAATPYHLGLKREGAERNIYVDAARRMIQEHDSTPAREILGIAESPHQPFMRGFSEQKRDFFNIQQNHSVDIAGEAWFSQQTGCDASNNDPAIVEVFDQTLHGSKCRK